jgi:L-ribulose-5-phosphate 3-epimerase
LDRRTTVGGTAPRSLPEASCVLRYAYNSNGLKEHSAHQAAALLASLGYDALELAFQREHLHPLQARPSDVVSLGRQLSAGGLAVVCGAGVPDALGDERFEPSLFHPDPAGRALRQRYLNACLQVAAELGARTLVFCSGVRRPDVAREAAFRWLVDGIGTTCRRAAELGLQVALEPEPGHFVESLNDFAGLRQAVSSDSFGMCLDLGHAHVTEDQGPLASLQRVLREERLLHVQIEDMRDRQHVHLPFGEGELDFPPLLRALLGAGFDGYLGVELSRDSHRAAHQAAHSLRFLRAAEARATMGAPASGE